MYENMCYLFKSSSKENWVDEVTEHTGLSGKSTCLCLSTMLAGGCSGVPLRSAHPREASPEALLHYSIGHCCAHPPLTVLARQYGSSKCKRIIIIYIRVLSVQRLFTFEHVELGRWNFYFLIRSMALSCHERAVPVVFMCDLLSHFAQCTHTYPGIGYVMLPERTGTVFVAGMLPLSWKLQVIREKLSQVALLPPTRCFPVLMALWEQVAIQRGRRPAIRHPMAAGRHIWMPATKFATKERHCL